MPVDRRRPPLQSPTIRANGYVDWIGLDGYDRMQDPTVHPTEFLPFYETWSVVGKPMMIGETGATTDQATYLADLSAALPGPSRTSRPSCTTTQTPPWIGRWSTLRQAGFSQVRRHRAVLPYFAYPYAGS